MRPSLLASFRGTIGSLVVVLGSVTLGGADMRSSCAELAPSTLGLKDLKTATLPVALHWRGAPLDGLFELVRGAADLQVDVDPQIAGRIVSTRHDRMPLHEALAIVARELGLRYVVVSAEQLAVCPAPSPPASARD